MAVMIVVLICITGKLVAMLLAIVLSRDQPLITIGDAIASFLQQPSDLPEAEELRYKGPSTVNGQPQAIVVRRSIKVQQGRRHPVMKEMKNAFAAPLAMGLIGVGLSFGLFAYTYKQTHIAYKTAYSTFGFSEMFALGLGQLPILWTRDLMGRIMSYSDSNNPHTSYINGAVLANLPQLALSALYLTHNNFITRLCAALELRGYTLRRRGLRVSAPIKGSAQRNSHFLSVPLRWSLLNIAIFVILHTVMSQTLFLHRVYSLYPNSFTDPNDIGKYLVSMIGFSPLSAFVLSLLLSALVLFIIVLGSWRIAWRFPDTSGNSWQIAIACRPPTDTKDAQLGKVRWGVVSKDKADGHVQCSFSGLPVRPPVVGEPVVTYTIGKFVQRAAPNPVPRVPVKETVVESTELSLLTSRQSQERNTADGLPLQFDSSIHGHCPSPFSFLAVHYLLFTSSPTVRPPAVPPASTFLLPPSSTARDVTHALHTSPKPRVLQLPINVTSNATYFSGKINSAKLGNLLGYFVDTILKPLLRRQTEPRAMVLTYHLHQRHAVPPQASFSLPPDCPFSITRLYKSNDNNAGRASLWLIRENDKFGEFPHIYAKVISASVDEAGADPVIRGVVVLSDTGCGTEAARKHQRPNANEGNTSSDDVRTTRWNLRTFLAYTINPHETLPYLVMTTHCHYDHILGLSHLLPKTSTPSTSSPFFPDVQVLASTNAKTFIQPYRNLQKHSLSPERGTTAPNYLPFISTWAEDQHQVIYTPTNPKHPKIATNITILTTPGHTPDSLTWYDADSRMLCVGDTFYAKTSRATQRAPWGAEPPMPIMFDGYSDLKIWWEELRRVLEWVRVKNRELDSYDDFGKAGNGRRVILAAAHVTVGDDAEVEIQAVLRFMAEVLRDEVSKVELEGGRWLWDHALGGDEVGKYSVLAPLSLVESARKEIPEKQWLR
ncbi:uncharacterized protein AB675_9088 [Cyphellophora attinorum]|uniref:Metallo-beta-lactamase domain-containing protein n=1 Tax=Cyphellophora attinorum TaxID=1664694 RepID=A0A0N1P003_9EURO|nr:uncharacterized protein AB675_9088 [Phialophora attinorum]KPI41452.1 hypothetical protein AB675_9088 [Phialophora attinorum]